MRDFLKRRLRDVFDIGQNFGLNIMPNHFYSAIPSMRDLKSSSTWRAPMSMVSVQGIDQDEQLANLAETFKGISAPADLHSQAIADNGERAGYGPIEAEVLYAFIRTHQPARIVQIGCGVSTAIILRAAKDAGYRPHITCLEPYPMPYLQGLHSKGDIVLRQEPAQVTPQHVFDTLVDGDLFFVDSTHTVKAGSEVNRAILETMPRINPGVWCHFHDIYFPYDYMRTMFTELFFNVESTLLHAYLAGNPNWTIKFSLSMLHYSKPTEMKAIIPNYDPQGNEDGLQAPGGRHFPSATWMRRIGS